MNTLKPLSMAKATDAAAKATSAGAASPSSRAAMPSSKAASLAFLMSLDQSASTVHIKHNDSPKGVPTPASLADAAVSNNVDTAAYKCAEPTAVPQLFKSVIQKIPAGIGAQHGQNRAPCILANPGQSSNKAATTAAAAAAAAAAVTAPPAQPSRVRQRSDEDRGNLVKPSTSLQPLSSASPRLSALLGSEQKKRKSSRTWKLKVSITEDGGKPISYKLDGQRFPGCSLPATLKVQFNTVYKVHIIVDHSLELGLHAEIKARSPAFFESYDAAKADPTATCDPLVLCKCTPLSWGQDVYEGSWRCTAEPVECTQRALLTMELNVLGNGEVQIPFLAKVYDANGRVFGHHPSEGLILGSATFDIEAAAFSGVLQVGHGIYIPPEPQSPISSLVEMTRERRMSTGGSKTADAKLLLALVTAGTKLK